MTCVCCDQPRGASGAWPCGCKTKILGGRPTLDRCTCCGNCRKHCTRRADVGPRSSRDTGVAKLQQAIGDRDADALTFTIGDILKGR